MGVVPGGAGNDHPGPRRAWRLACAGPALATCAAHPRGHPTSPASFYTCMARPILPTCPRAPGRRPEAGRRSSGPTGTDLRMTIPGGSPLPHPPGHPRDWVQPDLRPPPDPSAARGPPPPHGTRKSPRATTLQGEKTPARPPTRPTGVSTTSRSNPRARVSPEAPAPAPLKRFRHGYQPRLAPRGCQDWSSASTVGPLLGPRPGSPPCRRWRSQPFE